MRIDPTSATSLEPREAPAPGKAAPAAQSAAATVVKLSASATEASAPSDTGTTTRVARVRALLESGAYPVDLDQLASRIVDDEVLRT